MPRVKVKVYRWILLEMASIFDYVFDQLCLNLSRVATIFRLLIEFLLLCSLIHPRGPIGGLHFRGHVQPSKEGVDAAAD
jgi:hypothetical protein